MQELPDAVYKSADVLLIDSATAKTEVGDVIHAMKFGWIAENQIVTLSEIISGTKTIPSDARVVFKSVGMAAFDLSLAIAVFHKIQNNINIDS